MVDAQTAVEQLEVSWRPTPDYVEHSNLLRFMRRHGLSTLDELQRWSVADLSRFWDAVSQDLDLQWYAPYQHVLDLTNGEQWPRWWIGGQFNYVHNALDKHAQLEKLALVCEAEEGAVRHLTYKQLLAETNRCANALRALGIKKGDRVGLYLPMIPEVVIAQLALGKLGAIYTPIFSGFGAEAVAARLQDCQARLLITCDGIPRRGKLVTTKEFADEAVARAPSVEHVLVVKRAKRTDTPWTPERDIDWTTLLEGQSEHFETERTDPEDPYMIIYTSGTTGAPKGIVHVHGGFPIKGAQDMAHCFDVQPSDTVFWLTDMGWMMGPWLISGSLMLGATACLYDGTPDFPAPDRIWDMVERHRVSVLGIAPTAIRALMRAGDEWVTRHDLSSLRVLGSSGEPWNPTPWRWFAERVGGNRCPIINYSGGTEISGGIVCCNVLSAQKPTSFSGAIPGMDADVVDDQGRPVRGEVGELVLRQPWPGITRGFWRDPERYAETYWSRLPGLWVHGDWALIDADGYWYILGRSDDTIKVAGKRLGPAEVESAAVAHGGVAEAAAIGVPDPLKGEHVVVFCVPRGQAVSGLTEEVADQIARSLGKALKPEKVLLVRELPKTRSGKIMRRVIRGIYLGGDTGDLSSLENPTSLDEIKNAG